ncbi:MAG TPA: phosphohistidine phosphatase SixA [Pseudobdellovibrionaceae bacterium]|jgi:phosphohistidine phosphatase
MELILMRHGLAEDREEFAKKNLEDSARPLTMKGRKRTQKVAIQLRDWMEDMDLIVTSPFVRARQTADLVSQIFIDTPVVEAAELVPTSLPQSFKRWLRSHGEDHKRIMAVGHEPHLSALASFLMANQLEPLLEIKKSGVLCLNIESFKEIAPGSAKLLWLVQPRQMVD